MERFREVFWQQCWICDGSLRAGGASFKPDRGYEAAGYEVSQSRWRWPHNGQGKDCRPYGPRDDSRGRSGRCSGCNGGQGDSGAARSREEVGSIGFRVFPSQVTGRVLAVMVTGAHLIGGYCLRTRDSLAIAHQGLRPASLKEMKSTGRPLFLFHTKRNDFGAQSEQAQQAPTCRRKEQLKQRLH